MGGRRRSCLNIAHRYLLIGVQVIILVFAAVISLTTGIIHCTTSKACLKDPTVVHAKEACVEWVDGVAITVAVLLVGFITAGNDYSKEKQFRKLNAAKNVVPVKVLRDGARKEASCCRSVLVV